MFEVEERTGKALARFRCAANPFAVTSNANVNKTLNNFMLSPSPFQKYVKSECRPFCCRCLDDRSPGKSMEPQINTDETQIETTG
jgi:hypothetical protein